MKILSLLVLFTLACARPEVRAAAVRRVCLQGCDHNLANSDGRPIQAAINAAQPGDIIEIEAGQIFTENIFLPYKASDTYVTVRSSRWAELPPAGYRIDPEKHAALLPTVRPAYGENILATGSYRRPVTDIDLSTGELTFAESLGNVSSVSCSSSEYVLPEGIERFQRYFLRRTSPAVARLSLTPTGPFIGLSNRGQGTISCTEWFNGHHYRFSGIRWEVPPNINLGSYAVITIGTGEESSPDSAPHHIGFNHCVITGSPTRDSPRNGIIMNGRHLWLTDSWVGHIKQFLGESKAVVFWSAQGPIEIRNNFLSAASIGILAGGAGNGVGMPSRDVTVAGNYILKTGEYFYKEGDGPPSGACYYRGGSGGFYRDRVPQPNTCANGACYECQPNGVWSLQTEATYRNQNFQTKSGIEFKHCDNCTIEDNVIEGVFAGPDGGNVFCINVTPLVQGGSFHYTSNITIANNLCRDTWSGIALVGSRESSLQQPSINNIVRNNLVTGMAKFPELSIHLAANDVQVRPLSIINGQKGLIVDHNTFRSAPGAYEAQYGLLMLPGPPQFGTLQNIRVTNNILPAGSFTWFLDQASSSGCNALSEWVPSFPPASFQANVFYGTNAAADFASCPQSEKIHSVSSASVGFAGSSDDQLAPFSPFSARCTSGCRTKATDATDLGVDMLELNASISGSINGAPSWRAAIALEIEAGATQAILSFNRINGEACSVRLHSDAARINLIADTNQIIRQADTRESSTGDGVRRQFVAGAESPLTPRTFYHGILTCGSAAVPFRFRTNAPPVNEVAFDIDLRDFSAHQAVALVADNATMNNASTSSPVLFAGGKAKLRVSVPAGQVRYVRWQKLNADGDAVGQPSPVRAYISSR